MDDPSSVAVLLPGLDGTCDLFAPFIAAAPPHVGLRPLRLPEDRAYTYPELAEWVLAQLPSEPVALIAESFSGPLAILVAARCPRITAVVLCATFVEAPVRLLLPLLPRAIWKRPPPLALMSLLLTAGDRGLANAARRALEGLSADVVASRIAAIASADVGQELERLSCPVLYLQATRDRLVRARCGARVCALRPSVELAQIDGPHFLLQARPHEAWTHVAPFLERAYHS